MQAKVPPEMQGRVFTVMNSLSTGAMPLGMLMAGPLANALGTSAWFVIAGVTLLVTGVIAYIMKEVYTLDDQLPGGALQLSCCGSWGTCRVKGNFQGILSTKVEV